MAVPETSSPKSGGAFAYARQLLDRLIDLEFTNPLAFVPLAFLYIASRAPLLNLGYGTDPDAWRVALTANYLWDEAEYLPSRLPGYPLHEFTTALFIKGGWVFTNLSTVVISLIGVYLFACIARKLELPQRGALTLAFAFTPLLWINSVTTMDYMWALTFIMGAYLALLHRAPALAGPLLGLAAGFRLTSLGMLLPFALFLWRSDQRGSIRSLIAASLATAFVVYTPTIMVYGLDALNFYDQKILLEEVVKRLGKDGLGIMGALVLLVALGFSIRRIRRLPGDLLRDPHVLTWAAVVVVFFGSYTRLPHEIAYLIPVFPFGYFFLSRYLSRGMLVVALSVIVVAGFVDLTSDDSGVGIERSTFTTARIGKGMLLSNVDTLQSQKDFAELLRDFTSTSDEIERPAVVVTGFIYPELIQLHRDELKIGILEEDHEAISQLSDKGIAEELNEDGEPQVTYVWLLEYEQFQEFLEQGMEIYYTPDASRSTFAVYRYRPGYFGAHELPVGGAIPPWAGGAAPTDR